MTGKKETDGQFYLRRIKEYGRKTFEVVMATAFYVGTDRLLHQTLEWVGLTKATRPGAYTHTFLNWAVGVTYLIYGLRYLAPDAIDQTAETVDKLRERLGRHTGNNNPTKAPRKDGG